MVNHHNRVQHGVSCWLLATAVPDTDLSCTFRRFILRESGFPRYLHSAALLSGTLLVFGGNTHNDTSLSNGAKCFSADFLAYDIGMLEYVGRNVFYEAEANFLYNNFS